MGEWEAKRRTRAVSRGRAANVTFPHRQGVFFILRESNQATRGPDSGPAFFSLSFSY